MPERPDSYEYMPWFKKYSKGWLGGSIRFDCTPEERSVFDDLLCLANESRTRGVIQANNNIPYPHPWLAAKLNISLELLERCILKFTEQDRIVENEHGIELVSFNYYQGLDTRRRGRPTKRSRERPERTKEQEQEDDYLNKLAVAKMEKSTELGRPPTGDEVDELTVKIRREVYGDEAGE